MSRINTNISSLLAQHALGRANGDLQTSLTRLSTGLRINSGKDDPAGLIASEDLRRDITAVETAISNSERASQLVGTADSALGEINKLLNDVRGLVTEAANQGALSNDQIAANQLQIDSSLEAIDRIATVTTFQGRKLLDGSLDFIVDAVPSSIEDLVIDQANLGTLAAILVDVDITSAAAQAQLSVGSGAFALASDLVIQVSGANGSEVFAFASGATADQIVTAVNLVSDATGVTATTVSGDLQLDSTDYGADAFVSVEVISEDAGGTFTTNLSALRDTGSDVAASVNGVMSSSQANTLAINTATLDLQITVTEGSSTDFSFTIEGGGAVFQLGPEVVSNQQARIGLSNVNTGKLGGKSGKLYQLKSGQAASLRTNVKAAADIVDETITKVALLRGRLGAFQRTTLQSNITALQDTLANITDAESQIRDSDFAKESANLTRSQILVQSTSQVLALSNQNPQNVLALLG